MISPFHNEQDVVDLFYAELKRTALEAVASAGFDHRFIFVDDGSTDRTSARLHQLAAADERITVVSLSRNFGHQAALTAGLDAAAASPDRFDAVAIMDSDLQHPPAVLVEMLAKYEAGADIVFAVRRRTADASTFKWLTSSGFYVIFNALSPTRITRGAADFALLARPVFRTLTRMPEQHRFLRAMVAWTGFSRATVDYDAPARAAGQSKYGMRRMLALSFDAVFSFSVTPLRVATQMGIGLIILGFGYLLYVLGRAVFLGDLVHGWASLIATLLVLGGTQLLFLGIIGEYVARIYEQVKARPLYVRRNGPTTPRGSRSRLRRRAVTRRIDSATPTTPDAMPIAEQAE